MSYGVSMEFHNIRIQASNTEECLNAIEAATGSSYDNIVDAFECNRYYAKFDRRGNVSIEEFTGEKLNFGDCDDEGLWETVGPFIDANGYIECLGEDGDKWRWTFDGEAMIRKDPKIEWD